ncbi:hypothetical protein J4441_02475 [Candidatus Micrarchaeota archaeon]|nr:hypothetical protein [Candidatus Micrarchaeota archaeon]
MKNKTQAYAQANAKWKAVVKLLLGVEPRELKAHEEWLYDPPVKRMERKSSISGKPVVYAQAGYAQGAKCVSLDEIEFGKEEGGVDLGNVRDIAMLADAVRGKICYAGNIVLGNSKFVEKSTNIIDSFYVYHSEKIAHGKNIAYSSVGSQESECVFGSHGFGKISFMVKAKSVMNSTRCLELHKSEYCTDCYYSHGLYNCSDCIFCFNLRNRKYCIGNLELPAEKYFGVKKRILKELGEKLLAQRRLPALTGMFEGIMPDLENVGGIVRGKAPAKKQQDKSRIERAFEKTTGIIFGRAYPHIDRYGEWLSRFTAGKTLGASCASKERLVVPDHVNFCEFPKDRLVLLWEADLLGENLKIGEEEAMGISLENSPKAISKIAYFCVEWEMGNTANNIEAQLNLGSTDCYRSILNVYSKLCAYDYWPRDSECLFGCNEGRSSSFCIKCYHSENLQRCFEVDTSKNCSDCFFCHNCENVHDSMFCFNVKNMKYAIGNVEVGRERYLQVKGTVLDGLKKELEKTGGIKRSVFDPF